MPSFEYSMDACISGGGAHYGEDWFYLNWPLDCPEMVGLHINVLELKTVLESVKRWGGVMERPPCLCEK